MNKADDRQGSGRKQAGVKQKTGRGQAEERQGSGRRKERGIQYEEDRQVSEWDRQKTDSGQTEDRQESCRGNAGILLPGYRNPPNPLDIGIPLTRWI